MRKVTTGPSEAEMAVSKSVRTEGEEVNNQQQSMDELHCKMRTLFLRRCIAQYQKSALFKKEQKLRREKYKKSMLDGYKCDSMLQYSATESLSTL